MPRKILVIDGNSLMHRGFYAISAAMTAPDGRPTNAIFGFINMLLKALEQHRPDAALVAFDMHGPTFRHEAYAEYKAGRKSTPPELVAQFPMLRDLLSAMEIPWRQAPGFEADDILGTIARLCNEADTEGVLITGDRDALQLVSPKVRVFMTHKGLSETEEFTPEHFFDVYGLTPDKMTDLKGLMGDSSDNIPGVSRVGEKTALALLQQYGSLEEVLAHSAQIKGKLGERITEEAEIARFSKKLATIVPQAPIEQDLSVYLLKPFTHRALDALRELGMNQILHRLESQVAEETPVAEEPQREVLTADYAPALNEPAALYLGEDALTIATAAQEYRLPIRQTLLDDAGTAEDYLSELKSFFEGTNEKILYDVKNWMKLLSSLEITLNPPYFDVMLAEYLLDPLQSNQLDAVFIRRNLTGSAVAGLFTLSSLQKAQLKTTGMEQLYQELELPLIKVLYDMQKEGFAVDLSVLHALDREFSSEIARLTGEIWDLAGEEFNINSTRQLSHILFEKLELPSSKKNKTGASTDASVLEQLAPNYPIAQLILNYRTLTKLKSTYIDALIPLGEKGRIHSTFNQMVTATGRISSSEPNLQNIPVREEVGRQIRGAFVARDEEHILIDADYSQIELRVLAHMADDERMIAAFHSGRDIHAQTASEVFGVPLDMVTPQMRSASKAVNFGIVYGISDFGLSAQLDISRATARDYIAKYLRTYSGVKAFMERAVEKGREEGYAETLLGRRRPLPELKSSNFNTRSFGERVAMNAPVQGSAADIIKLCMVRIAHELEEGGYKARLILQVHDELIIDTPLSEADAVEVLLKETMETIYPLKVPLKADVSRGYSWKDAK